MIGRRNPVFLVLGGSGVVLAVLVAMLYHGRTLPTGPVVVQCAPALKGPLEILAKQFEEETGQAVELQLKPSQALLAHIQLGGEKAGDLFLPADDSYIVDAQKKDLLAEVFDVAKMRAVVLARADAPHTIQTFADLLKSDLLLAQAPDTAAITKLVREHLEPQGLWDQLKNRTKVFSGTVIEAANAVKLGSVHACIAFDVMAAQYPELKVIHLPELDPVVAKVQIGVVKSCPRSADALRFARFVTARDRGQLVLKKEGFQDLPRADLFAKKPKLMLHGGAMLRPAIEVTLEEFAEREGVEVQHVFNGCGILVTQMEAGGWPDIFFACDTRFMDMVKDRFDPPTVISANQLVIAVPKGNPKELTSLKDLGQEGLRLGVGHEQQCALGTITKETFLRTGLYAKIRKNVKVESPTGDFLINQLQTGALDVVVAYVSNVTPFGDKLEGIRIKGVECSPQQPVAVRKDSDYPQLAYRLLKALQSPQSRKRFEDLGFTWEVKQ